MKRIYYNVPPCPECGSRVTGRFIKRPRSKDDEDYIRGRALRNGEIIRFADAEPIKNAFCMDCGHRWGWSVRQSWVTREFILQEIDARKIRKEIDEFEEQKKDKPKKGFISRNFLW